MRRAGRAGPPARGARALDGIILPGGESTTIDKLSRIFGVRDPLVAALRAGLPAYGSCAGMILLADRVLDGTADQQTFGGLDITVRRNAFGRQVESFEADVELAGVAGGPVHAVFIRAPWVERVQGVEVLGLSPRPAPTSPGSSRSGRATCWPRRSTRRSPATSGSTATSWTWSARPDALRR